jgi:peptide/nickel transport system permease protein
MTLVTQRDVPILVEPHARRGRWWQLARDNPLGTVSLLILVVMVVAAIAAPFIVPHDPLDHAGDPLQSPNGTFWMGTDEFGRDLFARVVYGARTSLLVGVLAVLVGAAIGVPSGLLAGYFGGWAETTIMRFWDVMLAFPVILIAIFVLTIVGPGTWPLAFVLAFSQIPIFARLIRSIVLKEKELDYVKAMRVIGAGDARITLREILPNCLPQLIVQLSLAMAAAVLAESGLSFIGLGVQPPTPSWGGMLDASRRYMRTAWWYPLFPGLAIGLLVFALTYLADALGAMVDPRRARRTTSSIRGEAMANG